MQARTLETASYLADFETKRRRLLQALASQQV
jgi:hypothetical protein